MKQLTREQKIQKTLKEHYKEAESLGYEVFGVFLQGSQNYELDMDTEEYTSDVDTKAIVLPSFEEIVLARSPVSTTHVRQNDEHIDIKDIRVYFETIKKQNINYVEILFTPFYIANPKYSDLIKTMREHADELVSAHFNQSLRCIAGMSMEKLVALRHPYPTILDKIKKYGYDPKQLHHIVRLSYFIRDFVMGKPYKDCLICSDEERDYLKKIKTGILSEDEAVNLANELNAVTQQTKNNCLQKVEIVNNEAYKVLDKIKIDAMKRFFVEKLIGGSMKQKDNTVSYTAFAQEIEKLIDNVCTTYDDNYNKTADYDKEMCDLVHELELDETSYHERAKLAGKLKTNRQERRKTKDKADLYRGVYNHITYEHNKDILKRFCAELKRTDYLASKMNERTYVKRSKGE